MALKGHLLGSAAPAPVYALLQEPHSQLAKAPSQCAVLEAALAFYSLGLEWVYLTLLPDSGRLEDGADALSPACGQECAVCVTGRDAMVMVYSCPQVGTGIIVQVWGPRGQLWGGPVCVCKGRDTPGFWASGEEAEDTEREEGV